MITPTRSGRVLVFKAALAAAALEKLTEKQKRRRKSNPPKELSAADQSALDALQRAPHDATADADFTAWLRQNRAAAEAAGGHFATHVAKATHALSAASDASGPFAALPDGVVGTASVPGINPDYRGRGAATIAFSSLVADCVIEGRSVAAWLRAGDPDAYAALSLDAPACHTTAPAAAVSVDQFTKQVYWPVGFNPDGTRAYRVLVPLYPTALAARVHHRVEDLAWRLGRSVAQQRGGTQPQNVSTLVFREHGRCTRLCASPPLPVKTGVSYVRGLRSATLTLRSFGAVRPLLRKIQRLAYVRRERPDADTGRTRAALDRYLVALCEQVSQFAAKQVAANAPGWTAHERCKLPAAERRWLDPGRTDWDDGLDDPAEWQARVLDRLNVWLTTAMPVDVDGGVGYRFADIAADHLVWPDVQDTGDGAQA